MEEEIKLVNRGEIGCGRMLYKENEKSKTKFNISTTA